MICQPQVFAYSAPCDPSPGGIKALYIADPDNVSVNVNAGAGAVALSAATALTPKPFYKWEVAPGQSTLETEAQISEANKVRFVRTTLVAALNGFKPTSAGADVVSRLTRVAVIAELNNGSSVFLGCVYGADERPGSGAIPRGMEVTAFTWTPGQAKGDATRATLTAVLDSACLPLSVSNYSNLVNV